MPFSRTELLLGAAAMERLRASHVLIFGVGGVGGYAVEALARSGVGALTLVDADTVALSNLNRQIIALRSTIGQLKVDVAAQRIHDINPDCRVTTKPMFYLPENADQIPLQQYDYVIDCVDTITAKLEIIRRCHAAGVRLISSMGAANKLDPTRFRVADISQTSIDPLARILRKKLRKEGIHHLKVVYSEEAPIVAPAAITESSDRPTLASVAFVPPAAGLAIAAEVVKDLIGSTAQ